jgi:uncharacterized LabA/DUF88 family protein
MVFIDGNNLYHGVKERGWGSWIDIGKLAKKVVGQRDLMHIFYYNAPPPGGKPYTEDANAYFAFVQKTPNLTMRKSRLQGIKKADEYGAYQSYVEKGADTALSADLVSQAASNKFDTAIIISSDGDYEPAARIIIDDYGKFVEVIYFEGKKPFVMESCSLMRKFRKSYVDDDFIEPENSDDIRQNEDYGEDGAKNKSKKPHIDDSIEDDVGIIPIKNRKSNKGKGNKRSE